MRTAARGAESMLNLRNDELFVTTCFLLSPKLSHPTDRKRRVKRGGGWGEWREKGSHVLQDLHTASQNDPDSQWI